MYKTISYNNGPSCLGVCASYYLLVTTYIYKVCLQYIIQTILVHVRELSSTSMLQLFVVSLV